MALLDTCWTEAIARDDLDQTSTDRPDWTKLKPTIDSGRFYVRDAMTESLTPSKGPLIGGLSSKNVSDRRLTAGAKSGGSCKGSAPSVSGGYVRGAKGDRTIDRAAHQATVCRKRAQKRAKVSANRAYRAELIAELQRRGYAV